MLERGTFGKIPHCKILIWSNPILHKVAAAKGLIVGPLKISKSNGSVLDCSAEEEVGLIFISEPLAVSPEIDLYVSRGRSYQPPKMYSPLTCHKSVG